MVPCDVFVVTRPPVDVTSQRRTKNGKASFSVSHTHTPGAFVSNGNVEGNNAQCFTRFFVRVGRKQSRRRADAALPFCAPSTATGIALTLSSTCFDLVNTTNDKSGVQMIDGTEISHQNDPLPGSIVAWFLPVDFDACMDRSYYERSFERNR